MNKEKHQSIFIRGGEAFDNKEDFYSYLKKRGYDPNNQKKRWTDWLEWTLSERFESFTPLMPNKQWADYQAWKIWFEKLYPYLNKKKSSKVVLIGHSLGAAFLLKYLSENKFPKKIDQLHIVSPVIENTGLTGETNATFEVNLDLMDKIESQADKIFIYHSKDDKVVPYEHSKKLGQHLKKATLHSFSDRGHFDQPAFMELFQVINENL